MSLRGLVKHAAEAALLSSGIAALARRRHHGRTIVLAYHNIVPDGAAPCGDRSLHLPQRRFARQLDSLLATHDVISLVDIARPGGTRPRAVITFDDAYRGALTAGLAEVRRRGLPATIFVAPGILGSATWWDLLAADRGEVPAAVRNEALIRHQGFGERVMEAFGPAAVTLPGWALIATAAEVRDAATGAITLGAHTWSHCNLAAVDPAARDAELTRPRAWLREAGLPGTPWLAYPYGLFSPAVVAAARTAGYAGALRVEGGWLDPHGDSFAAPRLNVPSGVTLAGFRLRVAGAVNA